MATKVKQQNKREPGTSTISAKNQITLPVDAMRAVRLTAGDRVDVRPGPGGTLIVSLAGETRAERIQTGAGVFSGMYSPDYLDELRRGDW